MWREIVASLPTFRGSDTRHVVIAGRRLSQTEVSNDPYLRMRP
jgi:hypothetical protein